MTKDGSASNGEPKVVETYIYELSKGKPSFLVKRWEPGFNGRDKITQHKFLGWGRNGLARWGKKLADAELVPFNLPELRDAIEQEVPRIYVPEGEKDCEKLKALGEVATTNAGGAGQWPERFANYFEDYGGEVIIIADKDPKGYRHAAKVRASLRDLGVKRRVVRAFGKHSKDVSDHLRRHSLDELVEVSEESLQKAKTTNTPASTPQKDERRAAQHWIFHLTDATERSDGQYSGHCLLAGHAHDDADRSLELRIGDKGQIVV